MFWRSPMRALHLRSSSRSRLNMIQFLPVFKSPAQMRNYNGTSNKGGKSHRLVYLFGAKTSFVAFSEVISDAVVASQDKRTGQTNKLLRADVEAPFCVCIRVEVKDPFNKQIIRTQNLFVYPAAICIEVFYLSHGILSLTSLN